MDIFNFWTNNIAVFTVCVGFVGLLIGSFLNVVVYRLPKMLMRDWRMQAREVLEIPEQPDSGTFNLILPNSSCPHCDHEIKPWENIPLVSWLFLRGKCSNCKEAISIRYPLVELACGLFSAVIAWQFGVSWEALAMLVLTWGLLSMSLIDADHQILPDVLVLPLLWLGLILNSFGLFTSLSDALWGAVIGYMSLWSIFWLFKLITGKEGMGYGDFKLLALIGAWGGWQVLPLTILLSSVLGAVIGIVILRLQRNGYSNPIPFGPYLAAAGWVALIWGEQITSSYLQIAGF
ncbi:prepilin peptidase [Denitrificimonas caeni]|uniref:prepilin peptidase n=1 Tax=Denitrificimonas caeni TaxID=521720 RepID=UPI0003B45E8C|nr:A24 family peptidase [Denitrificimonas caeni]